MGNGKTQITRKTMRLAYWGLNLAVVVAELFTIEGHGADARAIPTGKFRIAYWDSDGQHQIAVVHSEELEPVLLTPSEPPVPRVDTPPAAEPPAGGEG